ncbi:MAG: hypothetical protein GDA41_03385 [Rhodospirillales bacterium]|nr:hypothetical protein [Rhodospirillales bacterium]
MADVISGALLVTEWAMAFILDPIVFMVVVAGGIGSLTGVFIASILIGMLQTFVVSIDISLVDLFALSVCRSSASPSDSWPGRGSAGPSP